MKNKIPISVLLFCLAVCACKPRKNIVEAEIQGIPWAIMTTVALNKEGFQEMGQKYRVVVRDKKELKRLEKALSYLGQEGDVDHLDYRALLKVVFEGQDTAYLGVGKMHHVEWMGEVHSQQSEIVSFIRDNVPEGDVGLIGPVLSRGSYDFLSEAVEKCQRDSLDGRECFDAMQKDVKHSNLTKSMKKECLEMIDHLRKREEKNAILH